MHIGFALLLIGVVVALLGVARLTLLLYDLARRAPLYRVGTLPDVAVVAILAWPRYQRFLAAEGRPHAPAPAAR